MPAIQRAGKLLPLLLLLPILSSLEAAPLGVYQGGGCTGAKKLADFSYWFGRRPDFVLDFIAADSWEHMASSTIWALDCWEKNGKIPLVVSLPMLPRGPFTLAEGAAGKYDETFRRIANSMVDHGYANAVVRIGWEFNGGWFPWAARKDPVSWVAYWRRIVAVMKSVPGAEFRFDWCPALGEQQLKADAVYPGDDVVDIIGMDTYNQSWSERPLTPSQRWDELQQQPYGLVWQWRFAQLHGKPTSFPEWGTGTRPDGHGGGDDAYFVTRMAAWVRDDSVAYHAYWDYPASDYNARLSDGHQPMAAAAFLKAFRSKVPRPPNGLSVTGLMGRTTPTRPSVPADQAR